MAIAPKVKSQFENLLDHDDIGATVKLAKAPAMNKNCSAVSTHNPEKLMSQAIFVCNVLHTPVPALAPLKAVTDVSSAMPNSGKKPAPNVFDDAASKSLFDDDEEDDLFAKKKVTAAPKVTMCYQFFNITLTATLVKLDCP